MSGRLYGTIGTDLYNLDLGTTSGGRECDVRVSRSRDNNVERTSQSSGIAEQRKSHGRMSEQELQRMQRGE